MAATATRKPKYVKPTIEQFRKYQAAYDYFNAKLFGGTLRPCLLVFRDGKKKKNAIVLGHFAWDRWTNAAGETCHEISLNPETLTRPIAETFGTLVHEMVHQWQQDHGDPPRSGYHDREWARKMVEVGLVPSDTGAPGGKQTGQRMTHYVDPDGAFLKALEAMPADTALPWTTGGLELAKKRAPAKAKNKIKYTCPGCEANAWGKPELRIVCGECEEPFEPAEG
ncbi:MAG TPA: SprT-like domain-containing protein [Urbifossiella sp.]|nr:SprT-like domain-containing protein [Urbifossiella sp.]